MQTNRSLFLPVLTLLVLSLVSRHASAASPTFHQQVLIGANGSPSLRITNDSDVPITAFLVVHFASLGLEGRDYFDVYLNSHEQAIPPGGSITRSLSAFKGAESKVRAEVRAVIFKDGSSAGDPVWVNAVLARRLRTHDRMLKIHDLLRPLVGTAISRDAVLDTLRNAMAEVDKVMPEDDLRIEDDIVFHGAISTVDNNREAPVDSVLKAYLKYLEGRVLVLEYSRPDLETIQNLPVATPKPLSDTDLPDGMGIGTGDLITGKPVAPAGSLPYCTVYGAQFIFNPTPLDPCTDSEGTGSLGPTNNQYDSFSSNDALEYTDSTGKKTYPPWSWVPGANDLDTAYGRCVGFYDCDGAWDVFYKKATASGNGAALFGATTKVVQGQNSRSFFWEFDDYPYPTFSNCDDCDPYPNNKYNPVSVNTPQSGIVFYFNYSCVVTP